jgi:ADP-heptose:LPS heptosyltransferase
MSDPSRVRRILVVELWNIGDVILLLPFLNQLRDIFPQATVSLLARSHARQLLGATGLVDEFIDAELAWEKGRSSRARVRWTELVRVARLLRERKFDVAFQCRPHVREYVLLALSGARRRVGMARRGWDRLLTHRVPIDVLSTQKKDAWLLLLAPFGGARRVSAPKLRLAEASRERAAAFLATHGVSTGTLLIGIHPGASVAEKRWPLERFASVIEKLSRTHPEARLMVFIDPEGYGSELATFRGVIPAKVDLDVLAGLLERCDLLICNDSGPMHVAAALGVHCVAVFGTGINRMFEPLGTGHVAVTSTRSEQSDQMAEPQYDVADIGAEAVAAAVTRVLG